MIVCYGDERGIVLEKLDPEVARDEPFTDRLTPDLAYRYVRLPGRVVGEPDSGHRWRGAVTLGSTR